jgi:hypothetical protein
LDVHEHEGLKGLEVDAFNGLGLVILFVHDHLLQGGDMLFGQLMVEDLLLQVYQVLVVHYSISVSVTDPKDSQ